MRTLMLMRHAKSDWKQHGLADHDRPLNGRGRRAAPLMGENLKSQGLTVDVILASSALRVQETVQLLQPSWGSQAEVLTEQALYLATPDEIARHVESLSDAWGASMVIGHNPGICALACHLAGEAVEMPTAAVVVLQSEADTWLNSISTAEWRLQGYWRPRELERHE